MALPVSGKVQAEYSRWREQEERQLEEQKRVMNLRYKVAKERLERRSKIENILKEYKGIKSISRIKERKKMRARSEASELVL